MTRVRDHAWCLFFDLDGTLTDPSEGMSRSFQHALGRLDRDRPSRAELTRYIGPPLRWSFSQLLATEDEELIETAATYYRQYYKDVGLSEAVVYEGIPQTLEALRSDGFPLYVVTSKPKGFAERIVGQFGLDVYFNEVFGPDFDGHFDDKADLLAHVLNVLSIEPAQSIMIGDRAIDVIAGATNGTRTIAVTYGFATAGELASTTPDRVCRDPREIRETVASLMGRPL
jgi:phosphoglycolate phosphatase